MIHDLLAKNSLSLRWKIIIPITLAVAIGIIATIAITGYATRRVVLEEIEHSTMSELRDTVLNALTTMMISGDIRSAKVPFIEQMSHIADLRTIRSDALDKDYGKGVDSEYAKDQYQKDVIVTGTAKVFIEGVSLRGIYPYIAKSNSMGKNCLSCHNVSEGTVLGAVDIKIPLDEAFARIKTLQYLFGILGLIGIIGVLILVFVITGIIIKPLETLTFKVSEVTKGNLLVNFSHETNDEIGVLSKNMNLMTQSFSKLIAGILGIANNIVVTVDVLRSRAELLAVGSNNQSVQASQIAGASEELCQTIVAIAKNTSVAAETSTKAMDIAVKGKTIADGAVETINNVHNSSITLSTLFDKLNERVREIDSVVGVINGIADQTNLLALNASIEAARAGKQGLGFAVVANEVRKLAERTIAATADISQKITAVQAEMGETTHSMTQSTDNVLRSTHDIKQVDISLNDILSSAQKARDEITQIAAAIDQQSKASSDVTNNIAETANIAQNMNTISSDVMHQVNALVKIVEELRSSTAGFKSMEIELMILDLAKTDHRLFVGKIASGLKGDIHLNPEQIPDHHSCRFGKWYDKEGKIQCGKLTSYQAINLPHEQIHTMAKEAIRAVNKGDKEKADQLYKQIDIVSGQIGELLDKIKRESDQSSKTGSYA
jgi:methyl-accepting chemotaxis protein